MLIYDYLCAECGHTFELFVNSSNESGKECPRCLSAAVARKPVMQMSIRTSNQRRGRVIDMSSNSCPCGCASGGKHVKRA